MPEYEEITLDNVAGGTLPERFAEEWKRVVENIDDPNREEEKAREVTIKIKVLPHQEDGFKSLQISAQVVSKLAAIKAGVGTGVVFRKGGELHSAAHNVRQNEFDFEPEKTNVKDIRDAKAASVE